MAHQTLHIDISRALHLRDDVVLQDMLSFLMYMLKSHSYLCIYSLQLEIFFCIRQSATISNISYIYQSNLYLPTFYNLISIKLLVVISMSYHYHCSPGLTICLGVLVVRHTRVD